MYVGAWFRGAYVSLSITDKSFVGEGESHDDYPAGRYVCMYVCMYVCT